MLTCPRGCGALDLVHRADQRFEVDACSRCGGVWLDSNELAGLCPTAAHLPSRRDEAVLRAVADRVDIEDPGIQACPRCAARPHQLLLVGSAIDFCAGCGGIWLDREEVAALVRDPPEERQQKMPGGSPFRQTATELQATGSSSCGACSQRVEAKELFAEENGFVCRRCFIAGKRAVADEISRQMDLITGINQVLFRFITLPVEAARQLKGALFDPRPKAWR